MMRKNSPSTKINPNKYTFKNNKYIGNDPECDEDEKQDEWHRGFLALASTPSVGIIGFPLYLIFLAVRKILKLVRKRKSKKSHFSSD
jgi:hypothetical protein